MVRIQRRPRGASSRRVRTESAHAAWQALRADIQGTRGETIVRDLLDACGLPTLHDVHLPSMARDGLTQIDHLLLLPDAVMVIETKHYGGLISGDPRDRFWRQRFDREQTGREIFSPLHQNAGHCAAVRAIVAQVSLDFQVLSRIVFTGTAEIAPQLAKVVLKPEDLAEEVRAASHRSPHAQGARIWDQIRAARKTERRKLL